jgi:hypothetical protein
MLGRDRITLHGFIWRVLRVQNFLAWNLASIQKSLRNYVYKTQLGVYDTAAKSYHSIFVVIDVGGMGDKLKAILTAKNNRVARGARAPDIVTIDATLKPSASKRSAKKD